MQKYNDITWHFIGKVQSNKAKIVSQHFHWCQTIDKEKIAILLNKYRPKKLPPMNVLIQINISKKLNKNGVYLNNYDNLAKKISLMPNLNLRGIMAMPLIKNNIQYTKIQNAFNKLRKQYKSIDTLSLGTSLDINEALLVNSNMLRIGRSIFNK